MPRRKRSNLDPRTDKSKLNLKAKQRTESRAAESSEQKQARLDDDAIRKAESRAAESSGQKQARLDDDAIRKAESRAAESSGQKQARLDDDAIRKAESRAAESSGQKQARLDDDAIRKAESRAAESSGQKQARLDDQTQRQERLRSAESSGQKQARLNEDASRKADSRAAETPEQTAARLADKRRRDSKRRKAQPNKYKARNAAAIMDGSYPVEYKSIGPLFKTDGTPVCTPCLHCNAVKWKNETPGMCCSYRKSDGPVSVPVFQFPPPLFQHLWEEDTQEARTFRKHIRSLNNALAMACLKVKEPDPPGGGWKPSVVIKGKVAMLVGPLQPNDGQEPLFTQLYVLDPDFTDDQEIDMRLHNMSLPDSVSDNQKTILTDLLGRLRAVLGQCNDYIKDLKTAGEIMQEHKSPPMKICIDANKRPDQGHARVYNSDFNEITVLMDDENPGPRQFALNWRGPGRNTTGIPDTNRAADPLHFVLLFPRGEDGWHLGINRKGAELKDRQMQQSDETEEAEENPAGAITPRQFYAFHLQIRYHPARKYSDALFRAGKLYHEYACIAFAKIENQRLKYFQRPKTQQKLRGDKYKCLVEDVHKHAEQEGKEPLIAGTQVILPPSHVGSPRYMHEHFQDAIAVCREYHKPDLFITFTCNTQWQEIQESIFPGQTAADRPDIVSRVFNLKLKDFMTEIKTDGVLGRIAADMRVIEFQKRGLPHSHILVIFDQNDRLYTADDVDTIISAELPEPDDLPEGSEERKQAERLRDLVLDLMTHVCSKKCLDDDGNCKKHFPQEYCEQTQWNETQFYPQYRRRKRAPVLHNNRLVDNRNVVPFCPYFTLRYQAHINFEACVSALTAKYLFKYVTKGSDRTMMNLEKTNKNEKTQEKIIKNEIAKYRDMRSIGASEAHWRIYGFPITDRFPAVKPLRVHLENEQFVIFTQDEAKDVAEQGPMGKDKTSGERNILDTELIAFFAYNQAHQNCTQPDCIPLHNHKYVDFPKHFTYNQDKKCWKPRQRGIMIGRLHTIHPKSGDEFYLRMLLHHDNCRGSTSHTHLRTYNGQLCDTYKEVCVHLGLLHDDKEWSATLEEAFAEKCSPQLRSLFVIILIYCNPQNQRKLFDNHWDQWSDDFRLKYKTASEEQIRAFVLLDIEQRLEQYGATTDECNLPYIDEQLKAQLTQMSSQPRMPKIAVVMQEENDFDLESTTCEKDRLIALLTPSQRTVFNEVFDAVRQGSPSLIFLSARGGTGKTFLLNTLLAATRTIDGEKNIALAVASSGIAATLLTLGRTLHSRFKVPLRKSKTMTFSIKPSDSLAEVIRLSRLIVWDEAPMSHKYVLEGLDRALQDIMQNKLPFGGKILVMAGDFRQVLPVVEHGSRAAIVGASMQTSHLWRHVKILELTENMRVGNDPSMQTFDKWLLDLGNGEIPVVEYPDNIEIPEANVFGIDNTNNETIRESRKAFISELFPNLSEKFELIQEGREQEWLQWLSERAILAPTNCEVDAFNTVICDMFPGELMTFYSADETMDINDTTRFPTDFLNSLTPAGMPPHELNLKVGMVIMLMRNLNPREGLCNGTRLILKKASERLLCCTIAAGHKAGTMALIPRIQLNTISDEFCPIEWKRRQFPVRPAFAMTINKSQGQTVQNVGVWLLENVFSHGQLYVAASRVTKPENLHFAMKKSVQNITRNVVYKEALL